MSVVVFFIVFMGFSIQHIKKMDMSAAPWNQLVLDSNYDAQVTISDLTSYVSSVFYLPTDSTLYYIFNSDSFMTFFEVSNSYDHGFWSTVCSVIFWLEIVWYAFMVIMMIWTFVLSFSEDFKPALRTILSALLDHPVILSLNGITSLRRIIQDFIGKKK